MGWQRVWAVPQDTLVGDIGGSRPAQFRVWPDGVLIVLPRSEHEPGMNGAATNFEIRDSDDETVGQRIVSPVKKAGKKPEAFIWGRGTRISTRPDRNSGPLAKGRIHLCRLAPSTPIDPYMDRSGHTFLMPDP